MKRAILTIVVLAWFSVQATSLAADDFGKIVRQVEAAGHSVPELSVLKSACDADPVCIARFLRDRIGAPAELVPDDDQPAQRSKWGATEPSIAAKNVQSDGALVLDIVRFDVDAILKAVTDTEPKPRRLVLDIRTTAPDQKLHDMRRAAGLFTGKVERAFRVRYTSGKEVDWTVPGSSEDLSGMLLEVWVGLETDAIGEGFAALLRKYANARLSGEPTTAKGYLFRRIPVIHGWTLKVPLARIVQLDDEINIGLRPSDVVPK